MAYQDALTALADPTRRAIFETLRNKTRTVSEIAATQPVSRPAVSQHLKVLMEAGLVDVESQGTRRHYSVRMEGIAELRAYVEDFWSDVLAGFAAVIEKQTESGMIEPVKKSITVDCDAKTAFSVFVDKTTSWWPLGKNSVSAMSGGVAKSVTIDPKVGGRITEIGPNGEIHDWGFVEIYEPGTRLVLSWQINVQGDQATRVDVRFVETGPSTTRIDLEHSRFEAFGEKAEDMRNGYNSGWVGVFEEAYKSACG